MNLILHAGTHKTGTTTIQHFLHSNRTLLLERGYYYLEEFERDGGLRKNHHQFAVSVALGREKKINSAFDLLQENSRDGTSAIVSSESFCCDVYAAKGWEVLGLPNPFELKDQYLSGLAELFRQKGFDVVPLLYFRAVDEFAESLYGTLVVGGHINYGFEEYLRRADYLFQYSRHVELWLKHFPASRIGLYRRENLLGGFLSDLNLSPEGFNYVSSQNVSPDPRVILWLLERSQQHAMDKPMVERYRSFVFSNRLAEVFSSFERVGFWRSERPNFIARYASSDFPGSTGGVERPPACLTEDLRALIDREYEDFMRTRAVESFL